MPTRDALRQRGEAMQSKLFGVATADPAIATIERLIAWLPKTCPADDLARDWPCPTA